MAVLNAGPTSARAPATRCCWAHFRVGCFVRSRGGSAPFEWLHAFLELGGGHPEADTLDRTRSERGTAVRAGPACDRGAV